MVSVSHLHFLNRSQEGLSTSPNTPSTQKLAKTSTPPDSIPYTIHYRPYPSGLKLHVNDALNQPIYHIYRQSSIAQSYTIRDLRNLYSTSLQIKIKELSMGKHYILTANHITQLSIRPSPIPKELLLLDTHQKIIARFLSLRSNLVVLRTTNAEFARIHVFKLPSPRKLKIKANLHPDQQWLFALFLYAIAKVEHILTKTESGDENFEPAASHLAEE